MTPNVTSSRTEVLYTPETTLHSSSEIRDGVEKPALKYRREIVWPNVVMHIYLNVAALYGAYLIFSSAKILTTLWGMCNRLHVVCSQFICRCVQIKFKL
jgi:stearoyl-CoA desaturase (delta-9 desaturase)